MSCQVSTLKRTIESLAENKIKEESLKKDITDLQIEIENLKDFNQDTHYKIRLIEEELEECASEEELEESASEEEELENSDDDSNVENYNKLNNNHFELGVVLVNKKR